MRIVYEVLGLLTSILLMVGLLVAFVVVIGRGLETVGQYREMQERCLKQAVSAYEAEQCR